MAVAEIATKILAAKNVYLAALIVAGMIATLLSASKMPTKLESHMVQTVETNKKLDVLICLQAKLDTPIRCVAKNQ